MVDDLKCIVVIWNIIFIDHGRGMMTYSDAGGFPGHFGKRSAYFALKAGGLVHPLVLNHGGLVLPLRLNYGGLVQDCLVDPFGCFEDCGQNRSVVMPLLVSRTNCVPAYSEGSSH